MLQLREMEILLLLHTYWHTSVPLRNVSHLPPLRQDSASCVHRTPVNRRRASGTAQSPGVCTPLRGWAHRDHGNGQDYSAPMRKGET